MEKYTIKYLQTKPKNISKRSSTMAPWSSRLYPKHAGVAQQTKVNHGNLLFKQTKWQNVHDYLIRRKKDLWQNPTHIHDKSPLRLKDPRDIPQHNKGSFNKPIANNKLNGEKLK